MDLNKTQGSMGIPAEMKEAAQRHRDKKNAEVERDASKKEGYDPGTEEMDILDDLTKNEGEPKPKPSEKKLSEKDSSDLAKLGPKEIFEKLDISFEEDDLMTLLMTGTISKEITIMKKPNGDPLMKAELRTLTQEEVDIVDELISIDAQKITMSVEGYESRKGVYIMATSIQKINGKPLIKQNEYVTEKILDIAEFTKAKAIVMTKMSPVIIGRIKQVYNALIVAVNAISLHPEEMLKNS